MSRPAASGPHGAGSAAGESGPLSAPPQAPQRVQTRSLAVEPPVILCEEEGGGLGGLSPVRLQLPDVRFPGWGRPCGCGGPRSRGGLSPGLRPCCLLGAFVGAPGASLPAGWPWRRAVVPLQGCLQRWRGRARAGRSPSSWGQWDFPCPPIHCTPSCSPAWGSPNGWREAESHPCPRDPKRNHPSSHDPPMGLGGGDRAHEPPGDLTCHVLPMTGPCGTLPEGATLFPSLPAMGLAEGPAACQERYFSSE